VSDTVKSVALQLIVTKPKLRFTTVVVKLDVTDVKDSCRTPSLSEYVIEWDKSPYPVYSQSMNSKVN
jgi:hypothetical protein